VTGFGRKGLEQPVGRGAGPPNAGAELHALRNGARGAHSPLPPGGEISRKLDAFRASERARSVDGADGAGVSHAASSDRDTAKPERSLMMAYLLWFILGQVSAHRFYLGAYRSAIAQVGLFAVALLIALNGLGSSNYGLGVVMAIAMIGWAIWVLGDVFFIHRLHRKLCRKPGDAAAAFA
jgi:hypothetical protein